MIGFVIGVIGLVSFGGSLFDWSWFMNDQRVGFFVALLGRNGARIFYASGGALMVVLGAGMLLGIDR